MSKEIEIHNLEFTQRHFQNKDKNAYNAHVKMLDDGEWVGDFFVDFVASVTRLEGSADEDNKTVFVATPSDVRRGNGIYVDDNPDFELIERVSQLLNKKGQSGYKTIRPGHAFKTVRSD